MTRRAPGPNDSLQVAIEKLIQTLSGSAGDHDLLIRIDTKVDVLHTTLQETRTALSARIDRLSQDKADNTSLDVLRQFIERVQNEGHAHDKHQDRQIAWQQKIIYLALGAFGAIEVLIKILWR